MSNKFKILITFTIVLFFIIGVLFYLNFFKQQVLLPSIGTEIRTPTQYNKQTLSPDLKKMDSQLIATYLSYTNNENYQVAAMNMGLKIENGKVLVDIYLVKKDEAISNVLTNLGMDIGATNENFNVIEGYLPVKNLSQTVQLPNVKTILSVKAFGTNNQTNNTDLIK